MNNNVSYKFIKQNLSNLITTNIFSKFNFDVKAKSIFNNIFRKALFNNIVTKKTKIHIKNKLINKLNLEKEIRKKLKPNVID